MHCRIPGSKSISIASFSTHFSFLGTLTPLLLEVLRERAPSRVPIGVQETLSVKNFCIVDTLPNSTFYGKFEKKT